MRFEERQLESASQELEDRLRFSHVILKRTKGELEAAKRGAERRKERTDRKIESFRVLWFVVIVCLLTTEIWRRN